MKILFEIFATRVLSLSYFVIVVAVFFATSYEPSGSYQPRLELLSGGKVALDLSLELIKYTATLSSAVVGSAVALTIKGESWAASWSKFQSFLTVCSLSLGVVSFYGTYRCYVILVEMVHTGYVDVFNVFFQYALSVQYYSLLSSAFIIGLVFVQIIEMRDICKEQSKQGENTGQTMVSK